MAASGSERFRQAITPYGSVVQRLHLGVEGAEYIDYVNPFAFLFHLCRISTKFAALLRRCVDAAPRGVLSLVIYGDEMTPGNPYRPEKSRTLQCVYWIFTDFPQYVLQRSGAWFVFATVRSTILEKMPGGFSQFMGMVLHSFFKAHGDSFDKGIMLHAQSDDAAFVIRARLGGLLCDDKAHTQNFSLKGASG